MSGKNPFGEHQEAIFMAATELYRADREGRDPSPQPILPQGLGAATGIDMGEARLAEAEVNASARAVARLAIFQDEIANGGFRGLLAKVETGLTRVFERRYVKGALKPGGIVEMVRGTDTTLSQ